VDGELEIIPGPSGDHTSRSVVELFDDQCAYYISIGMTYEQYWDGDAQMPRFYRKAEELRRRRENFNAWLQGAYFYEVIRDLAPSINALSKAKPKPYRDTVIPMTASEIREHEERKKKEQYEQSLARFKGLVEHINETIIKSQEEQDGSRVRGPQL